MSYCEVHGLTAQWNTYMYTKSYLISQVIIKRKATRAYLKLIHICGCFHFGAKPYRFACVVFFCGFSCFASFLYSFDSPTCMYVEPSFPCISKIVSVASLVFKLCQFKQQHQV